MDFLPRGGPEGVDPATAAATHKIIHRARVLKMVVKDLKVRHIIRRSGRNGPCKKALEADQIYLPKRLF